MNLFGILILMASAAYAQTHTISQLVSIAQFTGLGRVISTTEGSVATTASYSAQVEFSVFYSFLKSAAVSSPALQTYTVSGFRDGNCTSPGQVATAVVGQTKIFFVFISSPSGQPIQFSISDICQGGYANSTENLQSLSNAIASNNLVTIITTAGLPTAVIPPVVTGNTGAAGTNNPLTPRSAGIASSLIGFFPILMAVLLMIR